MGPTEGVQGRKKWSAIKVRAGNPSAALWAAAPVAVPKILCSLTARRILTAATRWPRCLCPRQRSARSPFAQGSLALRGTGAGEHVGSPLRGVGGLREPTKSVFAAVWRRGGTEPAPYTVTEVPAGGGVWSFRPTELLGLCRWGDRNHRPRLGSAAWKTAGDPSAVLWATAPFAQGSLALRDPAVWGRREKFYGFLWFVSCFLSGKRL